MYFIKVEIRKYVRSYKKIISHYIITGKYIFIFYWVMTLSITICTKKCKIFRRGQLLHNYQWDNFKVTHFELYCLGNKFFGYFRIYTIKNDLFRGGLYFFSAPRRNCEQNFWIFLHWHYQKWLVDEIWSHLESFRAVCQFFKNWYPSSQNQHCLKITFFCAQSVTERVQTHSKMKIYFPVIMLYEIIFL